MSGLSIQGVSKAISVGEKRMYTADIEKGNPVSFVWTFNLNHQKVTHVGKQV